MKEDYLRLINRGVFLLCLGLYLASAAVCLADGETTQLVPVKTIQQVTEKVPVWKKNWDEARDLVRQGQLAEALAKYDQVLAAKENFELPRWEQAKVLIALQLWERAASSLELLIECNSVKLAYLNKLALVQMKMGTFGRAVDLFSKARLLDADNTESLAGLVQALVAVAKKEQALPLLQELHRKKTGDRKIRKNLANLAYELGKYDLARQHMVPLANRKDADLDILLMTARVHDRLKLDNLAARYWQKVVKKEPGNREGQGRLALYYEQSGQYNKALEHLMVLLTKNPQNHSLLNRIIRIYMQSDRFAEALPYFEQYVSQRPDDKDALLSIININAALGNDAIPLYRRLLAITPDDPGKINALANDLLAIGEDEGALFMWEHIARLAPDQPEVYRSLADLLSRLGRRKRLIEVLETLHHLQAKDTQTILRLAFEYTGAGEYDKAKAYAAKLDALPECNDDCLLMRASVNEGLGLAEQALPDYEKLLIKMPTRRDIRLKCINLAARLGLLDVLRSHIAKLSPGDDGIFATRMIIGQSLAEAGAYQDAMLDYRSLLSDLAADIPDMGAVDKVRRLKYAIAELYIKEGLIFEAEEVLRGLYIAREDGRALSSLFDLALRFDDDNGQSASQWLDRFSRLAGVNPYDVELKRAMLLGYTGSERAAVRMLKKLIRRIDVQADTIKVAKNTDNDLQNIRWRAKIFLGRLYLDSERYNLAEKTFVALLNSKSDVEALVLLQKTYSDSNRELVADDFFKTLANKCQGEECRLLLGEMYDKYSMTEDMLALARKSAKKTPGSIKFAIMLARGLDYTSEADAAIAVLDRELQLFPENINLHVKLAHLSFQQGYFAKVLQHCEAVMSRDAGRYDILFLKMRTFLALDKTTAARDIYRAFFSQPVSESFALQCKEKGVALPEPANKRSFWEIITFSSGRKQNALDMVMAPAYVVEADTTSQKTLVQISAAMYARYRWEQQFSTYKDQFRWPL